MKKFLRVTAVAACLALGMLAMPMAGAAPVTGTNPQVAPDAIYPYVAGGRVDATQITWTNDTVNNATVTISHGVTDYFTQSYGPDDGIAGFLWAGTEKGGPDANGTLVPANLTYQVKVEIKDVVPGVDDDNVANVEVIHHLSTVKVQTTVLGNSFYSVRKIGEANVVRQARSALVKSKNDATVVLRYHVPRPLLTSEQRIDGVVGASWSGTVFRIGDGTNVNPTGKGVRVVTLDRFWGKVTHVNKCWWVTTEY